VRTRHAAIGTALKSLEQEEGLVVCSAASLSSQNGFMYCMPRENRVVSLGSRLRSLTALLFSAELYEWE